MIKVITEEEYNNFAIKMEQDHFLHSVDYAKVREKMGWEYSILGIDNLDKDDPKLLATMIMLRKKLPKINYYLYYCHAGIIVDYSNQETINLVYKEVKKYVKLNHGFSFKMDPDIKRWDCDVNMVPLTSQTEVYNNLLNAGFKHCGFDGVLDGMRSRHTFRVDLNNKTMDEIKGNFSRGTKSKVNKVLKLPIEMKKVDKNELETFYEMLESSAQRSNFKQRSIDYFKIIFDNYNENKCELYFAYLDCPKYILILDEEIAKLKSNNVESKKLKELEGIKKELVEEIYRGNGHLAIASAVMVNERDKAWYWFGGSDYRFNNISAISLIHYKYMEHCLNKGFKYYDFYGISSVIDKNDKDYGLYQYKKGFGGELIEFLGEFEIITNPLINYIYINTKKIFRSNSNNIIVKVIKKNIYKYIS